MRTGLVHDDAAATIARDRHGMLVEYAATTGMARGTKRTAAAPRTVSQCQHRISQQSRTVDHRPRGPNQRMRATTQRPRKPNQRVPAVTQQPRKPNQRVPPITQQPRKPNQRVPAVTQQPRKPNQRLRMPAARQLRPNRRLWATAQRSCIPSRSSKAVIRLVGWARSVRNAVGSPSANRPPPVLVVGPMFPPTETEKTSPAKSRHQRVVATLICSMMAVRSHLG
jgi:hypothetical protein